MLNEMLFLELGSKFNPQHSSIQLKHHREILVAELYSLFNYNEDKKTSNEKEYNHIVPKRNTGTSKFNMIYRVVHK